MAAKRRAEEISTIDHSHLTWTTKFYTYLSVPKNLLQYHVHQYINVPVELLSGPLSIVNNNKNMLERRKESDTYLATDSRHRRSPQIAMTVDKVCSFQSALRPSSVLAGAASGETGSKGGEVR